jgi:23S rRNA (adenine1618-N6)-methyltransferase
MGYSNTLSLPSIPGRADYIHYIADLLAESNNGIIPRSWVQGLDIGIGANCIYPIIGNAEYGWSFVGTDMTKKNIENCSTIEANPKLVDFISLQQQTEARFIF